MHILIVRNNSNSQAIDASLLLSTYLATQGLKYTLLDTDDAEFALCPDVARFSLDQRYDLAVALGGDGTILRTSRLAQALRVPILGINFGRLGFLANPNDAGVVEIVSAALAGDVVQEQRANLCIKVICEGDAEGAGDGEMPAEKPFLYAYDEQRTFFALNEIAVNRGDLGRIIDFRLNLSDARIFDMRGDGIIVATATGSTAYALSAGGPLVNPSYQGLVVVPLAPHSLHSRAIVADQSDVVEIDLGDNHPSREAVLFADGEKLEFERRIVRVLVSRGPDPTVLLRYKSTGFYEQAAETFFK